jgi:outer membrane immunogenic protein
MSKHGLAALAVMATVAASSAIAADLPYRKAPPAYIPPPPVMTWTGFYAGLNLGGGWSANSINRNNLTPYTDTVAGGLWLLPGSANGGSNAGGVVGGGQIGYNLQMASFVFGAEADFQGTSMRSGGNAAWALYPSPVTPGGILAPLAPAGNTGVALNWFGTVRGRAGYLITPTLLLYGTGGFAYGGVQGQFTGYSNTRTGWTAGGGVEWMFLPNWSAKAEYLFTDLSSGGTQGWFGQTWGYRRHPQYNVLRAGVNYHFNWGPAPALSGY